MMTLWSGGSGSTRAAPERDLLVVDRQAEPPAHVPPRGIALVQEVGVTGT